MMKSLAMSAVVAAAVGATACDRLGFIDRTPSTQGLGGAGGTTSSGGAHGPGEGGAGGATTAAAGLPCPIQTLLVTYCGSCHGSRPTGGAPRSLVTYGDLTRTALTDPKLTEAQAALQRIRDKTMPPAPAAGPSSAEIATLQGWITDGYPTGSCGVSTGGNGGGSGAASGGGGGAGATGGGGEGGTVADAGVPGGTLPCDVQTVISNRCASCHGPTPSGGAPRALVTYANLTGPDLSNPSLTEAQVAVERMRSSTSPMPPSPASPATSAEIATLQNWISGGYPSGSCGGDAGTPAPDPLNASPTCTSKATWNRGTEGSSAMEPGQACISCHARSGGEAPTFVIAGTLYPTGHEPDNCNGTSGGGAKVVVTGNNGTNLTLTPNSAGNFYSSGTLPPPYRAKVVSATGLERVMVATASTGDCNSCHTQNGSSGAPGRITLP